MHRLDSTRRTGPKEQFEALVAECLDQRPISLSARELYRVALLFTTSRPWVGSTAEGASAPHSQALPRGPATMPMRMHVTPPARNRSLATVRTVGAVVGAALAGALLAIFVVDRRIHIGDVGNDSLVPWWLFVGWGLVFYALYWVGFRYLLRTLRRNDAANKQLIAQLTAANENLELAQQLGRTGTWTATRDGMISWTGKGAELLGLPPSQTSMPAEDFAAIIDPADRKRALACYFSALRSRQPLAVDFRLNTPDGSQRWVSVRGAVSEDRSRIAGTIVDVSRQMQAHERLVTAEHQF